MTKKIGFLTTGSEQDSYVYIETSVGKSYALGADNLTDNLCLNSSSTPNVTPDESTANITISPETNGDIDLYPNGTGKTAILKGDLELTLGNLNVLSADINLPTTNSALTAGVINVNGSHFIHSYDSDTNDSTFVGSLAGNGTSTGGSNSGFGTSTLGAITSASDNCAFGTESLESLTSGFGNVAIGKNTGASLTSGSSNLIVGHQGMLNGNGDKNVIVGAYQAAYNYSGTESSNIIIGGSGTLGQTGDNHIIRIGETGVGDFQQSACYLAGTYGVTPSGSGIQTVVMDSNGQLGTTSSGGSNVSFSAYISSTLSNITGDATEVYPLIFDANLFNPSSVYDTTTGIFQAPVAGTYLFNCVITFTGATTSSAGNFRFMHLNTDLTTVITRFYSTGWFDNMPTGGSLLGSLILSMNQNEGMAINFIVFNGPKTVSALGTTSNILQSVFSGSKIG